MSFTSGIISNFDHKSVHHYILDKNNMKAVNMSNNPMASAIFLDTARNGNAEVLILHVNFLDYDEVVKAEIQKIFDFFNDPNKRTSGLFLNGSLFIKDEEFILKTGGQTFSSKAITQAPDVTNILFSQEFSFGI